MAKRRKDETEDQPRKKKRRWWLLMPILLVVFVWFAPSLVMRSPLKRAVLDYANPGINGSIDVQQAELSWTSPVVLHGVSVTDAEGNVAAEVQSVASGKTLWALAMDTMNLGTFTVTGAKAHLTARKDGSNLEDIIAPLLEGPSSDDKYQYRIDIADGHVVMTNAGTGRSSQFTDVSGFVQSTDLGNAYPEIALKLLAHADEATDAGGELQCNLTWTAPENEEPIRGSARVRGSKVSLLAFAPVLYRVLPDAFVDGRVKCDFAFDWSDDYDNPAFRFQGGAQAEDFTFASPELLGQDQLRSKRVQLGGSVNLANSLWQFNQLRAKADFADMTANGGLVYASTMPTPDPSQPFELKGIVNVADLANRLPHTIALQDGMRMTQGSAQILLASEQGETGWFWNGQVKTDTLRGEASGKQISWDDPLSVDARVRQHQDSFVIEQVSATSDFLAITGRGNLDRVELDGSCDLKQLKQKLEQFIDLTGWQLDGRLTGTTVVSRNAGGQFNADATVRASDLVAVMPGSQIPWREKEMNVEVHAAGELQQQTLTRMNKFSAKLVSGSDRLTADLGEPIAADGLSSLRLPVSFRVEGDLKSWLARLQPVASLPINDATGGITMHGKAVASTDVVSIQSADVTAKNLNVVVSDELVIAEPQLTASASGSIDLTTQKLTLPKFTIQATAFSAAGQNIEVAYGNPFRANAKLAVAGDLARIQAWQKPTPEEPWSGQFRGDLVVEGKGRLVIAQLDATLRDSNLLSMLDPEPARVATNPNAPARAVASPATLSCVLRYDRKADGLKIKKARVDSDALSVQLDGEVQELTTNLATDLTGKVAYDFEHLNTLLRSSFGNHIKVKGRGTHPFRLTGPLSGDLKKLSGSAKVSWDRAVAYGLECGSGSVDAQIADGIVRTKPIKFDLNGGTAKLLPVIDLRESPTLHVAKGTAIQNVQLTEEVTSEWMQFVAPLLADSARIQGQFSTSISGAVVPLTDPLNGDIAGAVQIQNAQAEPGPLVNRLIGVVDQVRTLIGKKARGGDGLRLTVPQQDIQFRMVQQRVHHQNFQIIVDGVPIKTSGSVGLDQSLQLTAELSLPDKWLGSSGIARSLVGKPIRIPVTGTLKRPRIDASILQSLSRGAAGDAANDLLRKNLDRGLNKLFDKIK